MAGLGDEIIVKVNNLKEEVDRQNSPNEPAAAGLDPNKLVLFLDDVEMKNLYPEAVLPDNELRFKLRRDDKTKDAWDDLLAKPDQSKRKNIKVGVGPEGKASWPQDNHVTQNFTQNFTLRVYDRKWLNAAAVLFLFALAVFIWLAKYTNIIRDSQPPEPLAGAMKPYSLARAQVAWWFFVILGSFLFILMVTGDYNTITTSSLVLLGIGSGTALGSAMVDANKRESSNNDLLALKPRQVALAAAVAELQGKIADVDGRRAAAQLVTPEESAALGGQRTDLVAKQAELAQLNVEIADAESAKSKPVSENFIKDVLSDVNGVTFHRFQILIWTIVLGIIFIVSVWNHLRMPTFDETLLALTGISGATYLGFKIPERQNEPGQPQPASTTPAGSAPPVLPAAPAAPILPAGSAPPAAPVLPAAPAAPVAPTGETATASAGNSTLNPDDPNVSGSGGATGVSGGESNTGGQTKSSDETDEVDEVDESDDDDSAKDDADKQGGGGES
jgi:hypothetical protein